MASDYCLCRVCVFVCLRQKNNIKLWSGIFVLLLRAVAAPANMHNSIIYYGIFVLTKSVCVCTRRGNIVVLFFFFCCGACVVVVYQFACRVRTRAPISYQHPSSSTTTVSQFRTSARVTTTSTSTFERKIIIKLRLRARVRMRC